MVGFNVEVKVVQCRQNWHTIFYVHQVNMNQNMSQMSDAWEKLGGETWLVFYAWTTKG